MPIYEYICRRCGHRQEALQRLGEGAADLACPSCGGRELRKAISVPAPVQTGAARDEGAGGCGCCGCCGGSCGA